MGKKKQNRGNKNGDNKKSPSVSKSNKKNPDVVEKVGDEIQVLFNSEINKEKEKNALDFSKAAYKTVFMSNENVATRLSSESNQELAPIPRTRSRSSILSWQLDGGAYEQFHNSRDNLRHSQNFGGGDNEENSGHEQVSDSRAMSHRSLYSDTDERCLAGFPRKGFSGSFSSVSSSNRQKNEEDDQVHILRQSDDLECLNLTKKTSSSSCLSRGGLTKTENSIKLNLGNNSRNRTASECSRKSDYENKFNYSKYSKSNLNNGESVRVYHPDESLHHGISKISIRTNSDEFVLVGGRPQDFEQMENDNGNIRIPFNRQNAELISNFGSDDQHMNDGYIDDELGRSISQRSLSKSSIHNVPISRTSSRFTVGTTSNTDDHLLLAAKHSQLPEAEGLVPVPLARSRSSSNMMLTDNVKTLVASSENMETMKNDEQFSRNRTLSHSKSIASNTSERVNFADIPTLFSHPDDNFNSDETDGEYVLFRKTSEHQFTPSVAAKRKSLRDNSEEIEEPPKALIVTSALTPVIKRLPPMISVSDESPLLKTPQTVQRVTDLKRIRPNVQENVKVTSEVAIQTGNTIRLRQGRWNADVLSELADLDNGRCDLTSAKTMSFDPKPKANNSFEKNGHPAATVLSKMLVNRMAGHAVASDPDVSADVRSTGSNSSHQVTIVQNSNSQTNVLNERLRYISKIYEDDNNIQPYLDVDENGNVDVEYSNEQQFVEGLQPLSTSTPAKSSSTGKKHRRMGTSGDELDNGEWRAEAFQKTDSEKSVLYSTAHIMADAKWEDGKRSNGDTLRKHIPKGRIREMANVFETIASPNNVQPLSFSKVAKDNNVKPLNQHYVSSSSDVTSRRGSSTSSNAFLQSTQNIGFQDDETKKLRSQSSSQPKSNVFTRNTFIRTSNHSPVLPTNIPSNTEKSQFELGRGDCGSGFVSMFEKISKIAPNNDQEKQRRVSVSSQKLGIETEISELREKQQPYLPPIRGDIFRRSMPNREPIRRQTPIFRRQTATIERETPKDLGFSTLYQPKSEVMLKKNQSNMEIFNLANSSSNSKMRVEVPIQRVERTESLVEIPNNIIHKKWEVPVERMLISKNEMLKKRVERAKTQEVTNHIYDEPNFYGNRAASGTIGEEVEIERSFFANGRESFGRQTTEDLSETQNRKWGRKEEIEEIKRMREEDQRNEKQWNEKFGYPYSRPLAISPKMDRSAAGRTSLFEKHPSKLNVSTRLSRSKESTAFLAPVESMTYSPPPTEDAGSRITHNTITTCHDDVGSVDNRLTAEESSIRRKIDRYFDFVEDESASRKDVPDGSTIDSRVSSSTLGKPQSGRFEKKRLSLRSGGYLGVPKESLTPVKYLNNNIPVSQKRNVDEHKEWERILFNGENESNTKGWDFKEGKVSRENHRIQSPERRNTVTGTDIIKEGNPFDNDLEYSLSQYREMQREQLRRRLSSAEEPKFFRSPSMSAPHAGQSLHAYRTCDIAGTPTTGEKIRNSISSGIRIPPAALATSTPLDSPHSQVSYSLRSRNQMGTRGGNETFISSISGVSAVDNKIDAERKINRLSYMIENTQKQLELNEAALLDAIKMGRHSQEFQIHRSILMSRETLKLQRAELRKLHSLAAVRRPPPPVARDLRGSVVFNNILLNLNKNYVSRWTPTENASYVFVALFKCGHQVEATECVQLKEKSSGYNMNDTICFEKQIQFSDVPVDFSVVVEFYAMRVPRSKLNEQSLGTSFAMKCKNLIGPPQKKSQQISMETAFKSRGRIVLDRDASGERCFYLDDVNYPLEGTVMINTVCSRLPDAFEIDFRGFLTMFLTISGMASWERLWAVLRRGVVFFWQYPDEEEIGKEPKMQIDLTKCTNNAIEQCSFDVCPKPYSFSIEILVSATNESTVGSIVEKKRVLLSADSGEILNQWLFALNQTLDVIRGPI